MKISIIIPTFNEEKTIHKTLKNLLAFHKPDEVIVVDGGSKDQTVSLASRMRARSAQPDHVVHGADAAGPHSDRSLC